MVVIPLDTTPSDPEKEFIIILLASQAREQRREGRSLRWNRHSNQGGMRREHPICFETTTKTLHKRCEEEGLIF